VPSPDHPRACGEHVLLARLYACPAGPPRISNIDAAQPVTLAIVLPLCFVSGVFIPILELPHWLIDAGKIFPVHALADALLAAYNPHTAGSRLRWGDLTVLAAWGAAGLIIAMRRFSWLPRGG
jgi:ABC-2 type transport system permease protein